ESSSKLDYELRELREEERDDESNDSNQSEGLPVHGQPLCLSSDPADWIVDETLREHTVKRPIVQNIGDFSRSERNDKTQKRYLSVSLFDRKMANGELVRREWLAYSPSTGNVFFVYRVR